MTEQHILDYYRFIKLNELLQSLGTKQAIVWCTYRKEFEIIKTMLGERCGLVYGDVNIAEKNTAIRAFKDGSIQFLIANPASADKGLTLTNAHHAIYFSLGYSYELWKQSIERIYGDIRKQPERCTYHIFIASGTIDRVIYDTVQKKGDMSTAVLEHLKGGL
ncbi:ATP-dependent RNA helicase SrmB [compost metagenome]